MKNKTQASRPAVGRSIIVLEIVGFLLVIAVAWMTAIFDPPYMFLNGPAPTVSFKPIDIYETVFQTAVIVMVATAIVFITARVVGRIKYLEGFMLVCASCKKVKVDENWVQIEKVLSDNSGLRFSHGICPACAAALYPDMYESN